MKPTTEICAKFESVGKPEHTIQIDNQPMREIVMAFGRWISDSYMGSHMRITVARTPAELERACNATRGGKEVNTDDMLRDLESMMAQEGFDLGDPEPELPSLDQ